LCACEIGHASASLLLGAVRRGRSNATSSDRSLREREGRPAHWYRARSSHLFRALARFDLRPTLSQLPRTLQRRQRLFPFYGQTSKQADALLFHSAGPRKACRRASPLPRQGPAPAVLGYISERSPAVPWPNHVSASSGVIAGIADDLSGLSTHGRRNT
jgi:hypothetical protein